MTESNWREDFVRRFPNTPPEDFFIFIDDVVALERSKAVEEERKEILAAIEANENVPLNFDWSMNECEYGCMDFIKKLIAARSLTRVDEKGGADEKV